MVYQEVFKTKGSREPQKDFMAENNYFTLSFQGLPERIFEESEMECPNDSILTGDSSIVNFFAGKSIFVTGATGFLGKLLIEKLMRSCPGIDTIYILARPKKGKDIDTRLDEIFNDVVS